MVRQLVSRGLIVLTLAGAGAVAAPLSAQAAPAKARSATVHRAQTMYTVRPGDSFSSIALRFHTTVPRLQSLNRKLQPVAVANPRKLRAGSRVVIR